MKEQMTLGYQASDALSNGNKLSLLKNHYTEPRNSSKENPKVEVYISSHYPIPIFLMHIAII